jgi:hypothetical protein
MICEKCKMDEISYLNYKTEITEYGTFDLDNGFEKYDVTDDAKVEFCCPECNEVLATDEKKAGLLLEGK